LIVAEGAHDMHRRTLATLEELQSVHWFSQVGAPDTPDAIVLRSWYEAIALRGSPDREDLWLDMANAYSRRLQERSKERWLKWNDTVDALKETLIPFVRGKSEPVVREYKLPKAFEDSIQWDLLHACMETEHADVCPTGFYANLASWYIKGHFPCGWQGVFPQGMLIIY
jgi:hypothetical protein